MPGLATRFLRPTVFFRDDSGGLTVESVLWLPLYGAFFALIADVSLILNGKSQAQRVIHDVNRLASSGYMVEISDIEDRARASLAHISGQATVTTTMENNIVTTIATLPASDMQAVGLISAFADLTVSVVAFHVVES